MKKTLLVCAVSLLSSICMADTVYLNDGQVIRGEIISQDEQFIVVESNNGNQETISTHYVQRIVKDGNYRGYRRRRGETYDNYGPGNAEEWIFNLGVDFDGKHETTNGRLSVAGSADSSINGTQNVNSGLTFGGEYVSYVSNNVGLGGGMTIQSDRGLQDVTGNFSFVPLYGLVKVRTEPGRMNFYKYLVGQLGYNFFDGDIAYRGRNGTLDGGLYFGIGAGVVINRTQIELLYTEDRGRAKDSGYLYDSTANQYNYFSESGDVRYSKLGLSIGFIF